MFSLLEFIGDVLNHWQTLVTGGIITAGITLYQYRTEKQLSWKRSRWIFGAFVLLAIFLAWKDKNDSLNAATAQLAARKPLLDGEIRSVITGRGSDPVSVISMIVYNRGESSIAENWQVSARLPNGRTIKADNLRLRSAAFEGGSSPAVSYSANPTISHVPTAKELAEAPGMYAESITEQDSLAVKALAPILRGGAVTGYLTVRFSNATQNELLTAGTKYTVEFTDIAGAKYSCSHTVPGDAKAASLSIGPMYSKTSGK